MQNMIAVIAASGRFPEASNLEEYWNILSDGKHCFKEIPRDRFDITKFYNADIKEGYNTYQKHGAFLKDEDIYGFDNEFFNISSEEALYMDPQQRILLELVQELFDRAGYHRTEMAEQNIGICLGAEESTCYRSNLVGMKGLGQKLHARLTYPNMVIGRVSDFFNLQGQSTIVNTACSSGLVAIHLACQFLKTKELDIAIAGAIQLNYDELGWISFSKAGALGRGSIMHVFDQKADGFILGEAAGIVMLKRFEDAIKDGDMIQGVILSSNLNNDGKTLGVTSPSLKGQKAVIDMTIKNSFVFPDSISYYEAHGTGTPIGDPIEIKAATDTYRQYTDKIGFCSLASVKSNIGHTGIAAGIASFIKILLSFNNRLIPATLNCENPNPKFNLTSSPFVVNNSSKIWESDIPRCAAVSAFGFGGTNAHIILQEGPNFKRKIIRRPLPITQFKKNIFSFKMQKSG